MKGHDFCEVVTREWGLSLEDVCQTANPWLPVDEPVTNDNCRFSEKGAEKILEIAKESGVHEGDIDWVELLDSLKEKETELYMLGSRYCELEGEELERRFQELAERLEKENVDSSLKERRL